MAERTTEARAKRARLQSCHPSFRLSAIHAMIPRGQAGIADRVVTGQRRAGFDDRATSQGAGRRVQRFRCVFRDLETVWDTCALAAPRV